MFPSDSAVSSALALVVLIAKATLLLVAALGVTVLLQRASAGARHLVWVGIVAAVLVLPALAAWSPLQLAILPSAISMNRAQAALEAAAPQVNAPVVTGQPEAGGLVITDENRIADPATASPSPLRATSWWQIAFAVWVTVAAGIATWLMYGFFSVRRIVRKADELNGRDWSGPLYEIADRLGLDHAPRLLRSDRVKMPFACGVVTPTIVLPAESDEWNAERRSAVLMHELAHIRRRDLLGHTLGRLACAAWWFHPLVWTAARRMRIESERACDDLALTCGLRATNYAEHLLDIVSNIRNAHTPAAAIPMAHRREFEGRMLAILDPDLRRRLGRWQSYSLVGALALMVIVVGGAVPSGRAQQLGSSVADRDALSPGIAGDSSERPVTVRLSGEDRVESRAEERAGEPEDARQGTRLDGGQPQQAAPAQPAPSEQPASIADLRMLMQGRQGDERATLLMQVLRTDTSASLRRVAAWGLSQYADREAVATALAGALRRDADPRVREMAAWAMASGEDRADIIEALTSALRRDADGEVRETAAWVLGNLGAESAVDALTAALSDPSARLRSTALWALGNAGTEKAPRGVIDALRDESKGVRMLAAWVLYNMEDPASVPALEAALNQESEKMLRHAYIRALGAVGEESAGALARLIDSRDPEVREVVVNALAGRAGGPWPWPSPRPRPFP